MDSPGKRTVRVTIYNQNYSLLSEGDPAEIEQIAQSVDELMTSIATRACLHLADRLRSLERELAEVR
jgi:cell division protein ZapA (FtsZ GTPase activity inhibitor)